MGTFHFVTLGYSPGVVTCPLYILSKYMAKEMPGGVQKVLIFTPSELREKTLGEFIEESKSIKKPTFFIKNNDVTKRYLHLSIPEIAERVLSKYVDVKEDIEVIYLPDKVNVNRMLPIFAEHFAEHWKHRNNVWVNPAGGTVPMSIAIMFMAQLYAAAGKIYYTYAHPGSERYLIPPDNWKKHFELTMLPIFPTFLHRAYILTLQHVRKARSKEEILSFLRANNEEVDDNRLRWMLLRLESYGYIEKTQRKVVLSSRGQEALEVIDKIAKLFPRG